MTIAASSKRIAGAGFLLEDAAPEDVFTPEDFSPEQKQIANVAEAFAEKEIAPRIAEIEAKQFDLSRALLRRAGDLGLLGIDVPEEYGGSALDKVTSALVADRIAICGSFSVTFGAQTGIGTLPLVWYGTLEQKQKYLPRLASGEWIAAYALSEATSGSDAMNIRTRARLSPDGSQYVLNGEKMWISNAGIADLFTVFAKIDGEKFSAFLVEKETLGLTIGKEEHKMGIRGSSTCPLVFADCAIPAGNLLGEAGKGHHIAFNILNAGRYKLGAAAIGGARDAMRRAVRYAKERVAFGKPIASFGLVQEKIAESAASIFAAEALVYRVVGAIDQTLNGLDTQEANSGREIGNRIEEYAIECSVVKVWCSEMLERVVDHAVQIHGGYGYTEDYAVERAYRDARINRIFEGTNEINRLIISGWTMKRAIQGRLPLLPAIQRVMDDVLTGRVSDAAPDGLLRRERLLLASAKKVFLLCAGAASQRYAAELADQQEIMAALAEMIIEIFAMDSAILRARKIKGTSQTGVRLAQYYSARGFRIVRAAAEQILGAVAEGDMLRTQMAILRRWSKHDPIDLVTLGREIADEMTAAGRYSLGLSSG